MRVAGIVGWHDSGKTTLLVALVGALTARGHSVSTVKHAHHGFDVDTPGKDSWNHRAAGAREVMVGSAKRWALMHELRGAPEPALGDLLKIMSPVDIVLVEGFKSEAHDKIEVWHEGLEEPPLATNDPTVVALVTAGPVDGVPGTLMRLDPADVEAVADFVERHWALSRPPHAAEA